MKKHMFSRFMVVAFSLAAASVAHAAGQGQSHWTEVRFFASKNSFTDDNSLLNAEGAAAGASEFKGISGVGLEVTLQYKSWLKFGMRTGGRWFKESQANTYLDDPPFMAVQQGYGGLILRAPLLQSKLLLIEAFGEAGFTTTTIDVKKSATAGTYNSGKGPEFSDKDYYTRYGASVGLGWENIYLFVEGGLETNRPNHFSGSGNVNSQIKSVDFGGPFAAAGIVLSGFEGLVK